MRSIIEKTIYSLLLDIFNVPVIFAYENAPRPCKPYITINYISGQLQIGTTDEVIYKNADTFRIRGQRQLVYSIMFIGKDSRNRADELLNRLQFPTILEIFQKNGFTYLRDSGVTDVSILTDTEFEERANIDLTFITANDNEDNIGYIDSIDGAGSINNGNDFIINI